MTYMKRLLRSFLLTTMIFVPAMQVGVAQQSAPSSPAQPANRKGTRPPPPDVAKADELAKIKDKTEQIEALVKDLRAKHADAELLGDVEVYAKAGRMLLEFPDMFGSQ